MKMTKESLNALRVKDLRALIVKHNLHYSIKRYSVMRKNELISTLMEHSDKVKGNIEVPKMISPSPSPEKSKVTPKRVKKQAEKHSDVKESKPQKKRKGSSKPKMTQLDKAMGIDKPLYSKEEGGLKEGARKQFEEGYHKYLKDITKKDGEFLKNLGKKLKAGEGKKRNRKPNKNKEFDYPSISIKTKPRRSKRLKAK